MNTTVSRTKCSLHIPTEASGYVHEGADVCVANKWNDKVASSASCHITIRLVWTPSSSLKSFMYVVMTN
jgi:hypothetical protein